MSDSALDEIFVSYASADLPLAEEVHRRLTATGMSVWFDKARLRPGCDWHREIEAGCEAARLVLPVLTPRWKLSEWTKFETYGAEATIPLIFVGTIDEIFTPPLMRFQGQAIDLTHPDEAAWKQLLAAIRDALSRPAPDELARLTDVRYAANPYFVGREADLIRIHEALHVNPSAVLTQGRVRAITALGGIGKTTLARQYVEKFWRCYPQIFWVDCRLGIETEFDRLCGLLLPEHRADTNVVQKARLALRELETRNDRLLILDNAEDEASIQAWIPKTGHCRTLISSRFAGWSAVVKSFHLYVLEPEPARTLLTTRAGRGDFEQLVPAEQTACESLAKELGYLPLALEQAAAYIGQQGHEFSFSEYLQLYGEATAELLDVGVLGSTEYPDSVMTTWATTLKKLDSVPKAILRLCAFLTATPLPLTVLTGGSQILLDESAAVAGSAVSPPNHIEAWVRQQVAQLRDYSMVDGDGQSITLHTLVQTVQRLNLAKSPKEHRTTLERSLHWIDSAFVGDPFDVQALPTLVPLSPHASAVVRHADFAAIAEPTTLLMSKLAALLFTKAMYVEAEMLMRRALAIDEQSCGTEHPDVAIDLNNLAGLLKATNRLGEAKPLMRRALAIDEQFYGVGHHKIAIRLNNLAQVLKAMNDLVEVEPMMRRALTINEQVFGGRHPTVAATLNNLAVFLLATNRLTEAEPLMRRALAINEYAFGAEHPNVARSLNTLAQLVKATERYSESERLQRRALDIDERAYDADHPQISIRLNNLAMSLHNMDRQVEAESLMRRALEIAEKAHGADHPNVAIRLSNLAQILRAMNRLADAEPLMLRAIDIDESSYGNEHPEVALRLMNLAVLLRETKRLTAAIPLMRQAIAIYRHSKSQNDYEHPEWTNALGHYRDMLQATGLSPSDVDAALQNLMAE